ncbi:MAG: Cupin 2 conserved barrel domain protein [Proteobacteria bacterium]|nr:Cupin 2 conserved barrel domain protein [Pseudomonadota bacterium]
MEKLGQNYKVISCGDIQSLGRVVLHDTLALTGAEVSVNELPAGVSVPFVHTHKNNEEIYVVLSGKGFLFIDGDEFEIKEGDAFRIDPKGERCIKAGDTSSLRFICVQAKANTLEGFTETDGLPAASKPSWL